MVVERGCCEAGDSSSRTRRLEKDEALENESSTAATSIKHGEELLSPARLTLGRMALLARIGDQETGTLSSAGLEPGDDSVVLVGLTRKLEHG